MDLIKEFINEYGMELLTTIITALAGWLAIVIKNLATKYLNDKTLIIVTHRPRLKSLCNKHYYFENKTLLEEKE